MMTQVQALAHNEQAIAQSEFEQYVAQADGIALEAAANFSSPQNFLSSDNPDTPGQSQASSQTDPGREPIKHMLIGSPKVVTSTIQALYRLGYADAAAWSPLVPSPTGTGGEVMSILVRSIAVQ